MFFKFVRASVFDETFQYGELVEEKKNLYELLFVWKGNVFFLMSNKNTIIFYLYLINYINNNNKQQGPITSSSSSSHQNEES